MKHVPYFYCQESLSTKNEVCTGTNSYFEVNY